MAFRHPGCDCPDGFSGDQCQFVSYESANTNANDGKKKGFLAVSLVFILVVLPLVAISVFWKKLRRGRHYAESTTPSDLNLASNLETADSTDVHEREEKEGGEIL